MNRHTGKHEITINTIYMLHLQVYKYRIGDPVCENIRYYRLPYICKIVSFLDILNVLCIKNTNTNIYCYRQPTNTQ